MKSTAKYIDEYRFKVKVEVVWEGNYVKSEELWSANFLAAHIVDEEFSDYVEDFGDPLDVADLYDKLLLWSKQAGRRIIEEQWPDQKYEELTEEAKPTVNIHVELESL